MYVYTVVYGIAGVEINITQHDRPPFIRFLWSKQIAKVESCSCIY